MKTPPTAQPMVFAEADQDEELLRAELYGLLARLWFAPPDAVLLEQFSVAVTAAPEPGSFLEGPWQDLVAAMRDTSVVAAALEHSTLFIGGGQGRRAAICIVPHRRYAQ